MFTTYRQPLQEGNILVYIYDSKNTPREPWPLGGNGTNVPASRSEAGDLSSAEHAESSVNPGSNALD